MSEPITFYLVDDGRSMPRWCELACDDETGSWWWVDAKGRRRPREAFVPVGHVVTDNVHGTTSEAPQVIAAYERDKAKRYLLDPSSDQGWVSPDGRFYGCAFFAHDDLAHALLRKSVGTLEDEGWLRIHSEIVRLGHRAVTDAQRATVDELGFVERGGLWGRRPSYGERRPPPRLAVRGPKSAEGHLLSDPEPKAPSVRDVDRLVARLATDAAFARWDVGTYEVHLDFGGRWTWMATRGDATVGGEEGPETLLGGEGLSVDKTSFDTAEVTSWPVAGIRIGEGVPELAEACLRPGRDVSDVRVEGPMQP